MAMKNGEYCPVCKSAMRMEFGMPGLAVWLCDACDHRISLQSESSFHTTDYHRQYSQEAFLDALGITRSRQACDIVQKVRGLSGVEPDYWLDFGCGRGWLLQVLKANGASKLAGADTSGWSMEHLLQLGIATMPIRFENNQIDFDADMLHFSPKILSLLDVIEHFPANGLEQTFKNIMGRFRNLDLIVIKIPVSNGLLFRIAKLLCRATIEGPIRQLFQFGTWPPHFQYFSHRSIALFVENVGLSVVGTFDDPDFDGIVDRLQFFRQPAPESIKRMIDSVTSSACHTFGCDSRIVIARMQQPRLKKAP